MPAPALLNRLLRTTGLVLWLSLPGTQAVAAMATNDVAWQLESWSSKKGLPNNTVYGLAQTPDGYLWLGTNPNGLARFDGDRFEEITGTNFISPPNRGILAMTTDRSGGLWIGMDRGAVVGFNPSRREVFIPEPGVSAQTINSLTVDTESAVWIAYRGGSVRRLKSGHLTQLGAKEGLPGGGNICSLANDMGGRLWFVKSGQLGIVRDGKLRTLVRVESGPARMTSSRGGGVWVCAGSTDAGKDEIHLYRYSEGGQLENHGAFTPRRPGTEPSVILEDHDGAVWIGTTYSGLFRYNGSEFENIQTSHPEILSLLEDAEGNIWVGTSGGGLNQLRPRVLTLETAETGLPFEAVQSLCEDTNGVVWATTQNGALARQIDGHWQVLPTGENWTGDATCLYGDPSGDVWVGTKFHRLLCWRKDRFIDWGDARQIKGQTIRTLVVAKNGDVWLGEDSPTAVQRLRHGKLDNFELPPDIRIIRAAAEDAAGNVWFGTSKGVLLRAEGDRIVDDTERLIGALEPIRYLYGTADGSLWIGFAGAGVGRVKDGRFAMIRTQHGLFDGYVSQIIEDGRGFLWFAADRGIFKVREQELEALAQKRASRVRSIPYQPDAGMTSLQASVGCSPMALRSRDGRLWLPMRTALAVVAPQYLRENSQPPPVRLSRVTVNDRTVAAYTGVLASTQDSARDKVLDLASARNVLRVPPDHRRIEFEFTGLSFVSPENVGFRHRLDDYDDDWVESSGDKPRSANYPRLSPGKHEFHVSACNSEGVWNETGATLAFEVTPFFWQTWWFRISTLAIFTAALIAIVRYVSFRRLHEQLRVLEQQAALHRERARIAKDIHDDLGANLTQISLLGELAHQDRGAPEMASEHIEKISTTARRAVKSLDEIVWAVNPRNDTLAHFIDYTGQYALDYLRVAGVRCRLDLPEQTPARELSTDVRHNLFLVVKEAINNTVKHAHATEMKLQIGITEEKLTITVEDNGCGFDQPPSDDGADGLRNMRQRLEDIGGECWIQGRPGGGARVAIELPWSRITNST